MFPDDPAPLADHHRVFWRWLWDDQGESGRQPFCGFWPRGGAKSTNIERGAVAAGARGHRHYVLYVCGTQEQADDHVQNISTMLQSRNVEKHYPALSRPALNKFGNAKGWRRNRLQTDAHFTVDALGLDTAARGIKVDDDRPDLIIIDDIDGDFDSPAVTAKKIKLLQKKILPAGAHNVMVIFIQNLIASNSIACQLARVPGADKIDLLHNRIISGPFPALEDFEYRARENGDGYEIISGTPTWAGQDVAVCQAYIDTFGISAFISECQNHVDVPAGGVFSHIEYRRCEWKDIPKLSKLTCWLDPAVTSNDHSDNQGIQSDGLGIDGRIYRLYSWEGVISPQAAVRKAILKAHELSQHFGILCSIGIETDQGGDTWKDTVENAVRALVTERKLPTFCSFHFRFAKAGAGHGAKLHRGQLQVSVYDRGTFVHVTGTEHALERAQRRFGAVKPYDLVDAGYWSMVELIGVPVRKGAVGKAPKKGTPRAAVSYAVRRGYRPTG